MQNRTDLALELKEEKNIGSAESGIIVKTRIDTANHIKETKIIIKNKKGEVKWYISKKMSSYTHLIILAPMSWHRQLNIFIRMPNSG